MKSKSKAAKGADSTASQDAVPEAAESSSAESSNDSNPYASLERLFHEPSRLAIVSALCGSIDGLSFREVKDECSLTDGNLSRHLRTLEEAGAIKIDKAFVGSRPRTTVTLTASGRESFVAYLSALETVLQRAADAVSEAATPRERGKAIAEVRDRS